MFDIVEGTQHTPWPCLPGLLLLYVSNALGSLGSRLHGYGNCCVADRHVFLDYMREAPV